MNLSVSIIEKCVSVCVSNMITYLLFVFSANAQDNVHLSKVLRVRTWIQRALSDEEVLR